MPTALATTPVSTYCYLARYDLAPGGDDLAEVVLLKEPTLTDALWKMWDQLVAVRKPADPMLQIWYVGLEEVSCEASTNQPFRLS